MMEQITQRIEILVAVVGGCSSRCQGRCELFLGEILVSGVVMTVTVVGIEESDVGGGDQGTVCVTMLVTVLMVVTTGDVILVKGVFRESPSTLLNTT